MMLQVGGALPTTPLELLLISSVETKVVLAILLVFSLIAWFIIVLKWWQFRRLHRQGGKFFAELERTTRLQEGYHAAMKQPPSPYNRLFREAINFYSELRPGALKEEVARTPLTSTQLESLKLVLMKEVSAEKDMLSRYIPWLATVGAVGRSWGSWARCWASWMPSSASRPRDRATSAAVAPGVAEALIATVAGLAAAIPAVIAYNLYVNKVRMLAGELEGFAAELIGTMAREGMV